MNRRRFVGALITAWICALPAVRRAAGRAVRRPRVGADVRARVRARTRPLDPSGILRSHDLAG